MSEAATEAHQHDEGDWVKKATGEAKYEGQVACVYRTRRGGVRYVVEVWPQGFQMICTPGMLERSTPKAWPV